MKNREISLIFEHIAQCLEFRGESTFRQNAYRRAARALTDLAEDVEEVYARGDLENVAGIGAGMASKIAEYLETGKIQRYEEARKGIPDTLIELMKRGIRLGVVSDAPRMEAWLRLCYLQLHHMFDFVSTLDDTGERKPSPLPFQRALDHFGIEANDAIMVGDWPERDITGAAQLGMRTVFARYGNTCGTVDSGAQHDIDDIYELVDIVDRLNGKNG